jgi:hypothetical protein
MKQDRFMIVILAVIGVLVIAALVLFFVRQGSQTYGAEDSPEGVLRNYALSLQKGDLPRAYSYLADTDTKPTYLRVQQAYARRELDPTSASLQIGSAEIMEDGTASVPITLLRGSGDPFGSTYRDLQTATLVKQDGAWKITAMPNPYWGWDWYQDTVKIDPTAP